MATMGVCGWSVSWTVNSATASSWEVRDEKEKREEEGEK
jgi:hypothetical protein